MTLDPTDLYTLLSAVAGLVVFAAVVLVVGRLAQRRYNRRLKSVYNRAKGGGGAVVASAAAQSLARIDSATPKIDRVARRWLPRRELLAVRLARTGRSISIGQYAMAMLILAAVAAAAVQALTPLGPMPSVLIGLFIGLWLPHWFVGRMGKRRVAAFLALFPDAIDLMVRAIRSGLPVSESIINAGNEIPDPVGAEFRLIEGGMRLGRDLETLLWDIAKRIDAPEFRFFIIAMSVQRETGGNLAETLGNLAEALRRRRQMRAKVRAMSSETRATTMILGGLPVVVIGLLFLTSPDYLKPLFHDSRGYMLDGIAVGMLVAGVSIMNRMARFEI
jgi:tight adherence protein B